KGMGRYRSFTYPQWGTGCKFEGNRLVLSKIGPVFIRLYRPLRGKPKTCTISKKADGWYASIACQVEPEPLPKTGEEVGIDVGITEFSVLSGEHPSIANPRHLNKAQAHLRKCQKRLERRTRRDKQNRLLAVQSRRRAKAKRL